MTSKLKKDLRARLIGQEGHPKTFIGILVGSNIGETQTCLERIILEGNTFTGSPKEFWACWD